MHGFHDPFGIPPDFGTQKMKGKREKERRRNEWNVGEKKGVGWRVTRRCEVINNLETQKNPEIWPDRRTWAIWDRQGDREQEKGRMGERKKEEKEGEKREKNFCLRDYRKNISPRTRSTWSLASSRRLWCHQWPWSRKTGVELWLKEISAYLFVLGDHLRNFYFRPFRSRC